MTAPDEVRRQKAREASARYRARNSEMIREKHRADADRRRAAGYYREWHQDVGYWRSIERRYGVSREWYEATLERQGGVCAICGVEPGGKARKFAVDHSHETGEPRGILCGDCNRGLGDFCDNIDSLFSAAAYLLANSDVLGKVN